MEQKQIKEIEKIIGYEFQNKALLIQAFTRESYAKEQRVKGIECYSNEQLEFFGDSVLNYLVVKGEADKFTSITNNGNLTIMYKEGKLSEFNSNWTDKKRLSACIDNLGLAEYLIMSKGDIKQEAHNNASVKEDLFEALVGAIWLDSNKNLYLMESIVFNMLKIKFNASMVDKNYVSKLHEYADKYKLKLKSEVKEITEGFEVTYTLEDNIEKWTKTGVGKNIKEAEQNAARKLIEALEGYGVLKNKIPEVEYSLENAINVLQELNQKGYIGEITYEDSQSHMETRKPYWIVTCKVANYAVAFKGESESKKQAKKEAAYNALIFIYHMVNKTSSYNPDSKPFVFLVNMNKQEEVKVLIIDSLENEYTYKGHLFPDNKELSYFMVNDMFEDANGDPIKVFKDPIEAFAMRYGNNSSDFKLKLTCAYNLLPYDVSRNGVLVRNALSDFINDKGVLSDLYLLSKKCFDKQNKLYHFTSYETLKLILGNLKLRLSVIDECLNDPDEINYIPDVFKRKVYTVCFTDSATNNYFWNEYAKNKEDVNHTGSQVGVCIEINKSKLPDFNKFQLYSESGNRYMYEDEVHSNPNFNALDYNSYKNEDDWCIREAVGLKVVYKDNPYADCSYDDELVEFFKNIYPKDEFKSINNPGFVKSKDWHNERESRIRVLVHSKGPSVYFDEKHKFYYPKPNFRHMFLDISGWLKGITIIIKDEFLYKDQLKAICEKYGIEFKIL